MSVAALDYIPTYKLHRCGKLANAIAFLPYVDETLFHPVMYMLLKRHDRQFVDLWSAYQDREISYAEASKKLDALTDRYEKTLSLMRPNMWERWRGPMSACENYRRLRAHVDAKYPKATDPLSVRLAKQFSIDDMLQDPSKWKAFREAQENERMQRLYGDNVVSFPAPEPEPVAASNVIQSSAEFVRGFVPPEYLIDGMLQRRFCYALTARGGVGKTAVAMRLAAHVATGTKLGSLEVEKGTVLYFGFENPTDIQMRWLGLTSQMGIDPETADIHFVTVGRMSELAGAIELEMHQKGIKPALVIIDTVAAAFEGDNENDNTQMIAHARLLRSLTTLDGGPCVLMLAHPPKNAAEPEGLVPRGGSGFLNEIDGNIGLMRDERLLGMQVVAKFRGVQFNPVHFELLTVNHPRLVDSKGRSIPTVVAKPVDEAGVVDREAASVRDVDSLLREIGRFPGASQRDIAKVLNWNQTKVSRVGQKLEKLKLIEAQKMGWKLTTKGATELSNIENAPFTNLPAPPK